MNITAEQDEIKKATATRPLLREVAAGDDEKIAVLQDENGLNPRSHENWAGLWSTNPALRHAGNARCMGWVLECPVGGIVGYAGNLPLEYRLAGRRIRAASIYSWVVSAACRRHSLRLLDQFLHQPNVDLFVFATVNPASERVYQALGFRKAPAGNWDKSDFWITRHRGFAEAALRELSVPMPKIASYPMSAAMSVRDACLHTWRFKQRDEFELLTHFDSRFDSFWDELQAADSKSLLAVRDRETLAWHFQRALAEKRAAILAATRNGRLVAYAVFDRWDLPRLGLKRMRIVDFQALPSFDHLLRPAIGWMLRHCRNEGIHMLENIGCWMQHRDDARIKAPYRRNMKSCVFYYSARDRELSEALKNPAVWAPTTFDGDASI